LRRYSRGGDFAELELVFHLRDVLVLRHPLELEVQRVAEGHPLAVGGEGEQGRLLRGEPHAAGGGRGHVPSGVPFHGLHGELDEPVGELSVECPARSEVGAAEVGFEVLPGESHRHPRVEGDGGVGGFLAVAKGEPGGGGDGDP
ncbi:MAG: hypothetical protein H6Q14_508, partial [Bacteroidetes bacterium]|nr:hypothetical protein [Bacteroidota bacterium]